MKYKVLIINNYDSFTYILKQYFGELGGSPEVFFNDKISVAQIKRLKPTHIVLSPGPGTVEHKRDVGIMFDVIKEFHKKIPILGVCLGHQAIGKFFGLKIACAPKIMHGKRSWITHGGKGIFKNIPSPFEAMRYHSLILKMPPIPSMSSLRPMSSLRRQGSMPMATSIDSRLLGNDNLAITAQTKDGLIMGIEHKKFPIFGVQFHPESLGTPQGKKIIKNFLNLQF
jgi:anthranilate synthase component 2